VTSLYLEIWATKRELARRDGRWFSEHEHDSRVVRLMRRFHKAFFHAHDQGLNPTEILVRIAKKGP